LFKAVVCLFWEFYRNRFGDGDGDGDGECGRNQKSKGIGIAISFTKMLLFFNPKK